MNLSDERLKNPKVRQALKHLVDYQGMVNTFLKGRFLVQQAFLPIGIFGAIAYNPYKLDVAKAKALLAEAGYPERLRAPAQTCRTPRRGSISPSRCSRPWGRPASR